MDAGVNAWLALFSVASVIRITLTPVPVHNFADFAPLVLPYLLVAIAPLAGYRLALRCFDDSTPRAQPSIRFSPYGRWRRVDILKARKSRDFGPAGFMASLLIGLLLNVVLRSIEFLMAVPPLNGHAPLWGQSLFQLLAADVIVMSFFYMVCFVMALRSIPYFPRMLLFAWALDITMQLLIAHYVTHMPGLPLTVSGSLHGLLHGNIQKVLISAFVWLPYLILSDRVNLTYRQRVRCG